MLIAYGGMMKLLKKSFKHYNLIKYIMSKSYGVGRLGNQIIRNLAVSLIAEKHNLKVNYYNEDLIIKLGIILIILEVTHMQIQDLMALEQQIIVA